MASVNKVIFDDELLMKLYVAEKKSLPVVSRELGTSISTTRLKLNSMGVLRDRAGAVRLAAEQGRLGSGLRGKNRSFTEEWRKNISEAKLRQADQSAVGTSTTSHGYTKFTRGPHLHRSVHVVAMEAEIGRRLKRNEVVHHKDHNKQNNHISNLELMTRKEHSRLHAQEAVSGRKRKKNGQFE